MIIYDLICEQGHSFEGWFQDASSLQEQLGQGLVQCPVCGTSQVSQRLSTGGTLRARGDNGQRSEPYENTHTILKTLQRVIETHFENVGAEFAKVALRIHYGIEEPRNIRGTTTEAEEEMLRQEGVEFLKVPLPVPETEEPIH